MPRPEEMAAVPTVADLDDKWGIRREALRSLNNTEKGAAIAAAFDEVMSALNKRVSRPILYIDDWLKALVCRIASADLLGWRRGFNPRAGQDAWIEAELARIKDDLEAIRLGKVEPDFTDSTLVGEQGPIHGGSLTPDAMFRCNPWPWRGCC